MAGGVSLAEAVEELKTHHQWIFDFESRLGRYLPLKYEDLVDGRLAPLQSYLSLALDCDVKVDPAHDHVARTRRHGDWKNWFLEKDVEYFKPATEEYLLHFGYPTGWEVVEHPKIPSAHASDYVLRTVEKRRRTSSDHG